jgi:hypothetical protein
MLKVLEGLGKAREQFAKGAIPEADYARVLASACDALEKADIISARKLRFSSDTRAIYADTLVAEVSTMTLELPAYISSALFARPRNAERLAEVLGARSTKADLRKAQAKAELLATMREGATLARELGAV